MIRIINPAWLSIVVDGGRFGYADVGVPPSSALDGFAYLALQALLGNPAGSPAIEVMGFEFSIEARVEVSCAITGARVVATLDGSPLVPWTAFRMKTGSVLRVSKVVDGFRYYVGFAGTMDHPPRDRQLLDQHRVQVRWVPGQAAREGRPAAHAGMPRSNREQLSGRAHPAHGPLARAQGA